MTACMILMSLWTQTQSGSKVSVEPAAIVVVRDVGLGENEVGPFNQNEPGTKVALLFKSADSGILNLVEDESKITMKDDKGTDLLAAKPKKEGGFSRSGIWPFPKFTADRKGCIVEIAAHGVPAKGAKSVAVEGTLMLTLAQGQETLKAADVKLQKGTKFKACELEFQVEGVEKSGFDENFPVEVSIGGGKGGRKLAKLRFLDVAGKEIESKPGGTSRMSGFGSESWTWGYRLKSEVQACTVEVTLWKQVTDVPVPVKLTLSLGF